MGGLRFGRYELGPCIARGGMAQIHFAIARGPEGFAKPVVLKRLHPHLAQRPEVVELFLEEARLAAQLLHPYIGQVYELGQEGDEYFLSMEYLAGEDLGVVLERARSAHVPLPPEFVAYVGRCVADALHFAHHLRGIDGRPHGVVHGDVSPSNVVVTFRGEVKVIDFGIARSTGAPAPEGLNRLAGKRSYLAPEQVSGGTVDGRADVFALGVVLHELLTGERLFRRESDHATLSALLHDPIPDPRQRRSDVPEGLANAVLRALERDPEKRFSTAEQLKNALDQVLITRAPAGPFGPRCAAFMRRLFGDDHARARQETTRDPTGTGTAPFAHGGQSALTMTLATAAIPLEVSGPANRSKSGFVRVAAEVPAALVRAGSTLVAVPSHVASFALAWSRVRLIRWTTIVSLAAFLTGLGLREIYDAAHGVTTVIDTLAHPAEPPPPPVTVRAPLPPPTAPVQRSPAKYAQTQRTRHQKNRRPN